MKRFILGALIAGALSAVSFVAPASAQATRTWVSGVGDDANPCSRTAPCKTFAGAISKTAANGEINCLDSGGFGALTITKGMTVKCVGVEAGVLVSGTNGIVVQAGATDDVVLDGLDFEGLGPTALSLNGVKINSARSVQILHSRIAGFQSTNGTDGNGVFMASSTNNSIVTIEDCDIGLNLGGVRVQPAAGVNNTVSVLRTMVTNNVNFGLQANGATSKATYAYSYFANNGPNDLSLVNSGQIFSFGQSATVGSSVVGTGSPTQIIPFK
jgi:hypothetical protein